MKQLQFNVPKNVDPANDDLAEVNLQYCIVFGVTFLFSTIPITCLNLFSLYPWKIQLVKTLQYR